MYLSGLQYRTLQPLAVKKTAAQSCPEMKCNSVYKAIHNIVEDIRLCTVFIHGISLYTVPQMDQNTLKYTGRLFLAALLDMQPMKEIRPGMGIKNGKVS